MLVPYHLVSKNMELGYTWALFLNHKAQDLGCRAGHPSSRIRWLMLGPYVSSHAFLLCRKSYEKSLDSPSLLQVRRFNSLRPKEMSFFKIHRTKIMYPSMMIHVLFNELPSNRDFMYWNKEFLGAPKSLAESFIILIIVLFIKRLRSKNPSWTVSGIARCGILRASTPELTLKKKQLYKIGKNRYPAKMFL